MKNTTIVLILLLSSSTGFAADRVAILAGSNTRIRYVLRKKTVLLDAAQTAKAFDWQLKIVRPGKLITLCRDSGCIPIRLTAIKSETVDNRLYVEADALGKALSFSIRKKNDLIALVKLPQAKGESDNLPAYNAKWGKGRGFRVGQTLPDIPLVDLEGSEVRFSKFLGKQYIIYCWASW